MSQDQAKQIETLVRARYPIIYVVSWEEYRVDNTLREVAQARNKRLFSWTTTNGMIEDGQVTRNEDTSDPIVAMDAVMASRDSAIFVFKDFHPFLHETRVVRKLRDLSYDLKRSYKTVVIVSPVVELPVELEKEITVIDYALPTEEEISAQLDHNIERVRGQPVDVNLTDEQREAIIKAAQGLTATEVDNVLAKSLVAKGKFDVDVVLSEKEQIIRKSGILEYYPTNEDLSDVGGLELLKGWLRKRTNAFSDRARDYGLPQPKGVLLIGVQGCGKSLTAKAVASLWSLPLLRLDVGRIFSGIVGSSEERMRRAIATAESIAPAVLWLDEVEKGFSGTQSSSFSDAGTTSRVFGTFVTWLQEKEAPVFVMATANDIKVLPPELLRKGRFDELFFVDLPAEAERQEIFRIHLAKRKRNPGAFECEALGALATGFSGAEIEQVVISGMYDSFDQQRALQQDDIVRAIQETFPLSATMREQIDELREWALTRARPASPALSDTPITVPRLPNDLRRRPRARRRAPARRPK